VRDALDDARGRGLTVHAACPFVAWFIQTHEDYQDLAV
jgi:predicted GNAT family acetyltransferase